MEPPDGPVGLAMGHGKSSLSREKRLGVAQIGRVRYTYHLPKAKYSYQEQ